MTDEARQLAQIAAGDPLAFGQWVAGVESSLRLSLRSFATVLDTEAVLQEALLRVWQVAPRFVPDGRPNALLRFAMVATRNAAISELRRAPPRPEALDALERELEAAPPVGPIAPDPMLRRAIAECREKLPRQPRQALEQRLQSAGADDDGALAQRVNMKLNTFLQNVTRARKLLEACLGKKGVDLTLELYR